MWAIARASDTPRLGNRGQLRKKPRLITAVNQRPPASLKCLDLLGKHARDEQLGPEISPSSCLLQLPVAPNLATGNLLLLLKLKTKRHSRAADGHVGTQQCHNKTTTGQPGSAIEKTLLRPRTLEDTPDSRNQSRVATRVPLQPPPLIRMDKGATNKPAGRSWQ